jgi:hypothetical protein
MLKMVFSNKVSVTKVEYGKKVQIHLNLQCWSWPGIFLQGAIDLTTLNLLL